MTLGTSCKIYHDVSERYQESITSGVSAGSPPGLGDGVQLVEEEDAGGGGPGLVEDVPHVGLGLSEPHGEQLGALDGDEVGLALVSDGLGNQGLTWNKNVYVYEL